MSKIRKQFVIFDLDGTVIDTNGVIIDSWQAVFRKYLGRELPESEIIKTFGETIWDTMDRLLPGRDKTEITNYYRSYQSAHVDEKLRVFDGIIDVLEELNRRGHVLAVVTSRTRATAEDYMDRFGLIGYFNVMVACEDTEAHKPDPEPLLIGLEKLGANPDEAIMIGDAKYDIGCAGNAGVESVIVGWSHPVDDEDLRSFGFEPTYKANRPWDIIDIVTDR
jgi:pyrophosphatase PpaX